MKYQIKTNNKRQLDVVLEELYRLGYTGMTSRNFKEHIAKCEKREELQTTMFDTNHINSIVIGNGDDYLNWGIFMSDYTIIPFQDIFSEKCHLAKETLFTLSTYVSIKYIRKENKIIKIQLSRGAIEDRFHEFYCESFIPNCPIEIVG